MVALIAVSAVAVSAGAILTTQMLGATDRGDPVAVPPQSSIQEAIPGDPSRTRSRPSVFCHRDERPVDCVRWMQPLDHRVTPLVTPTTLGPLLHVPGILTLLDEATGRVIWDWELDPREGFDQQDAYIAGVTTVDQDETIVLVHGDHLEFRDLHTGALLGAHLVAEPGRWMDDVQVSDTTVHATRLRLDPDEGTSALVVSAWTPKGQTWEVAIALGRETGHLLSATDAEIAIRTWDETVVLDAQTGQELRRDESPHGHHAIDGDVGLRTEWDERDPDIRTLLVDDLQTGQALWTQELDEGEEWWLLGSGVVAVFQRPQLVARDTRTGEVLWNLLLDTRSEFIWAPYNATDLLILVDESTQLIRVIATATGEERWRFTSPSTLPSALHWFYPDANHVALRHRQRDGFVLLDRNAGHVVIDLTTDGRLFGEPWATDVRWPVLQSSTGHLYLVSLDLPETTRQ
jgi:outer membrane protein assembly factor BamB